MIEVLSASPLAASPQSDRMSKNANKDYSYLDYCVLPHLREWVLANEPVVLFASALDEVLWSNAAGAVFFGCESIGEMLQSKPSSSQPFIKQLKDAAPQIEGLEPLRRGFRIVRGMRSELIDCELRLLNLPNGEATYLLIASREARVAKPDEYATALSVANSLLGFASAAAVTDDAALTLAATDTFSKVDLDPEELSNLVKRVTIEEDRLVKEPIEAHDGSRYALGIARISDTPGRNLIVLAGPVETADNEADQPSNTIAGDKHSSSREATLESVKDNNTIDIDDTVQNFLPHKEEPVETGAQSVHASPDNDQANSRISLLQRRWNYSNYANPFAKATEAENLESSPDKDNLSRSGFPTKDELLDSQAQDVQPITDDEFNRTEDPETTGLDQEVQVERNQGGPSKFQDPVDQPDTEEIFESAEPDASKSTVTETVPLPVAKKIQDQPPKDINPESHETQPEEAPQSDNPVASPEHKKETQFSFEERDEAVRFAWTIDADQNFVSVSPEFAETVGPRAADVIDRKWSDVASVFGFDESGAIAELLSRKDTWSGKSVLWPVQGTDIVVPIDLAALPAFNADREFEGFKGFGIIRTADAILDPNSVGLALSDSEDIQILAEENSTAPNDHKEQDLFELDEDAPIRQTLPPDDEDAEFIGNVVDLVSRLPASEDDGDVNPVREDLSSKENEYFAEIGERLRETADSEWEVGSIDSKKTDPNQVGEVIAPSGVVAKAVPEEPVKKETGAFAEPIDPLLNVPDKTSDPIDNSILDELPVPLLIYKNGDTLFANAKLLELTQYGSKEEISDLGGMDALLENSNSESDIQKHHLNRKDGTTISVNPILRSVPWNRDRAIMATFQVSEISEIENPPSLLDATRIGEMQDILDTATDGIIVLDRDGIIETFNGSAEALFGQPSVEIVGTNIESLFALESRANLLNYIKAVSERDLKTIINDGSEVIGKEANGGLIPLFVTLGKMGDTEKLCLVIRDMTSWKKSEEELVSARRQAEKASDQKSDFLARVSHEIRTPLNAIIGFSDVMIEERFGPIANDRYKEYLLDINRSGIHVLDLVNDLLDLSKIESGKIDLSFEAVDLNQIVSETVALMQPQANTNRIIIRTSLSRVVPKVVADARSMRQIIMNLVSNAIKFSQANGQVIVSTVYESNGEVALRIRDTGVGMTDEELEDAMKPFYQIPGVSEKTSKGTGLGLPLTKALVEANRAHFDLESQFSEGTIAHVQFPTQRVLAD